MKKNKKHLFILSLIIMTIVLAFTFSGCKKDEVYYQISYHLNDGISSAPLVEQYQEDDHLVLPTLTKDGYRFIGWYDNGFFTGEKYTEVDGSRKENLTLYAYFEKLYVATFIFEDQVVKTIEFTSLDEIDIPEINMDGYMFLGVYDEPYLIGETVKKIPAGTTKDLTFYVSAKKFHQLTFDPKDGTMPNEYLDYYLEFENDDLPVPSRKGYLFKGWSEQENATNGYLKVPSSSQTDLHLYAVWEKEYYNINYILGEDLYFSKDNLYVAFFGDFYNYIVEYRDEQEYLQHKGIYSLDDFLTFCSTFTGGSAGMSEVGNLLGSYYLSLDTGGNIADQTADGGFIGWCLANNRHLAFIEFIQEFFYWWRIDEGYTGGSDDPQNTGSDFLASPWASIVDTAKFFYYDLDTLPSYFFSKEHIPNLYNHIPGIISTGSDFPTKYDWETGVTLPTTLEIEGYTFMGWYDNPDFEGNPLEKLPPNIYHSVILYAKFEKTN